MNRESNRNQRNWLLGVGAAIGDGVALYAGYKLTQGIIGENNYEENTSSNIHIVNNSNECKTAALKLLKGCKDTGCVGFNILWTNNTGNRRERVGLLQLSTIDGYYALIRLCYLGTCIPLELENILEDETILKVGVGAHQGASFLKYDYKIKVNGTLDLSELATYTNCAKNGLDDLTSELLQIKLQKPSTINWEKATFLVDDIKYASDIAIASIKLYQEMKKEIVSRYNIGYFVTIKEKLTHYMK